MEILLDYKKNRPVAEKLVVTQRELEKIKRQRDTLEKEITAKGWKTHKLEYEQVVPKNQLAIVNKKLDIPTDPKELADLMKDFRQHLGKYPDIINLMRKRRSYSFLDLTKKQLKIGIHQKCHFSSFHIKTPEAIGNRTREIDNGPLHSFYLAANRWFRDPITIFSPSPTRTVNEIVDFCECLGCQGYSYSS